LQKSFLKKAGGREQGAKEAWLAWLAWFAWFARVRDCRMRKAILRFSPLSFRYEN
jgi:hypothetical protein